MLFAVLFMPRLAFALLAWGLGLDGLFDYSGHCLGSLHTYGLAVAFVVLAVALICPFFIAFRALEAWLDHGSSLS